MADFLNEFDRRAKSAATQPTPSTDLSQADRDLLDFADLIRKNRALPTETERKRVMEHIRAAEAAKRPPKTTFFRLLLSSAIAAAAACLIFAVMFQLNPRPKEQLAKTIEETSGNQDEDRDKPSLQPEAKLKNDENAPTPVFVSSGKNEFEGINFPKPTFVEGQGAEAVEAAEAKNAARLLRVHGLVSVQRKNQEQWRLASRGTALAVGDVVRTGPRLESSARILAPDGSVVALGPSSLIAFNSIRSWDLKKGLARFEVAKRPDLDKFTVHTPQGQAQALGTVFTVWLNPKTETGAAETYCRVEEGRVAVGTAAQETRVAGAGETVVLNAKTSGLGQAKPAGAWLDVLNAELANDHGIGQLVAKAEEEAERLPLEISKYKVTVTAIDQVTRTFVEMVFENRSDRRLEGVFYYPLPADASISEFSMYVDDKLIEGEVVEQQKARQVFEYIVRQQRDPALLEYAGGNLFKMRVFPIEPKSEKRIQLGYTQILPRRGGLVTYTFPLYSEMLLKNPLRDLSIEFQAFSSIGLSGLKSPSHRSVGAYSEDRKAGSLGFRAKNYSPNTDFSATYAVANAPECVAYANRRPDENQDYFLLQLCPKTALPQRRPPDRLLVLADGSASTGPQGYAMVGEFTAVVADLCSWEWKFLVVRGGQKPLAWKNEFSEINDLTSTQVRDFLNNIPPLGATDLMTSFRKAAELLPMDRPAHIVYVGDGIDTVSELSGPALVAAIAELFSGKNVTVSTIAVGSNCDVQVLQGLAAVLGGTFLRVEGADDLQTSADQALQSLYRPVLRKARVKIEGAPTQSVYSENLGTIFADDTAIVLGRFAPAGAAKIHFFADADGQPLARTYDVNLSADEAHNRFLPRLWARAHIDGLLRKLGLEGAEQDAKLRDQIIETSVRYQIMSPFTAFLVLESEEDYARYGIKRSMKMWDWKGQIEGLQTDLNLGREKEGSDLNQRRAEEPPPRDLSVTLGLGEDKKDISSLDDPIISHEMTETADHHETSDGLRKQFLLVGDEDEVFKEKFSQLGQRGAARHGYGNRNSGAFSSPVLTPGKILNLEVDATLRSAAYYRRVLNHPTGEKSLSTKLNYCLALERERKFGEALKALAPVIQNLPNLPDLWLQQGVLRFRMNDEKGGREDFAKALELTPAGERKAFRERIANVLNALTQYAEAADIYAALLQEAGTKEEMAKYVNLAASQYAIAGQHGKAVALFDEQLKQFPDNVEMLSLAGNFFVNHNQNPKRGLELLQSAQKAGAQNCEPAIVQALLRTNDVESAKAVVREQIAKAQDAGTVYQALCQLVSFNQGRLAADETANLLGTSTKPFELQGALQFVRSYSYLFNQNSEIKKRLLMVLDRKDFPALPGLERLRLCSALVNMGIGIGEVEKHAQPALADLKTEEEFSAAVYFAQLLFNHGQAQKALDLATALKSKKEFAGKAQIVTLIYTERQALLRLGREKEAFLLLQQQITAAKDAGQAYSLTWELIVCQLNQKDFDGAISTASEFAKRFPDSPSVSSLLAQTTQQIGNYITGEERSQWLDKLSKALPDSAGTAAWRAQRKAENKDLRGAVEELRKTLEELNKQLDPPAKSEPQDDAAENEKSLQEQKRQEEAALKAQRRAQRVSVLRSLGALCGRDAQLRADFLKEAEANAKTEDLGDREWTEAALICLQAAGDMEAYGKRLAALAAAEPNDQDWIQRLANLQLSLGQKEKAIKSLLKVFEFDRENRSIALVLNELYKEVGSEKEADEWFERAFELMAKDANSLQNFAYQMQSYNHPQPNSEEGQREKKKRLQWALKAWERLQTNRNYTARGQASFMIAQLSEQLELPKVELAQKYFQVLLDDIATNQYAFQMGEKIAALAQQEEILRSTEAKIAEALARKPSPSVAVVLHLLTCRIEKIKNRSEAAKAALQSAVAVDLAQEPQPAQAMQQVLSFLIREDADLAADYALNGGGKLPPEQRVQLIRTFVQSVPGGKEELGIRLAKKLLYEFDAGENSSQTDNDRQNLINLLLRAGQLPAAEAEVRKITLEKNNAWSLYNPWQNLIQHYQNKQDRKKAISLCVELWERLKDDTSGHADNALHLLLNAYRSALQNKQLDLDDQKKLETFFLQSADEYFSGKNNNRNSYVYHSYFSNDEWKSLGVASRFQEIAQKAGESDSPICVFRAANYFLRRPSGSDYAEARKLYRRALSLNPDENLRRQIALEFYGILTANNNLAKASPEWDEALQLLETFNKDRQYDENSYHNAENLLWNAYRSALQKKQLALADQKKLETFFLQSVDEFFSGKNNNRNSYVYHSYFSNDELKLPGVASRIQEMAQKAGESDSPICVFRAANYFLRRSSGSGYAEAKKLYRRALSLNPDENLRRQLTLEFYGILTANNNLAKPSPEWDEALQLLETLYKDRQYDENSYHQQRARCLYALNRKDEARTDLRKLMTNPNHVRLGYWQLQNFAGTAVEAKDWEMALELYEKTIRIFLLMPDKQSYWSNAYQLYSAMAHAYSSAGQDEKALDCYLRALSVVPRTESYYRNLMEESLRRVLKGRALDAVVEEYEKEIAGGGAEKPYLRLAFAEGYRQAGKTAAMLAQKLVASRLLPKDTQLRKEVADGYLQQKDYAAAIAAYLDWAKLDPQNIDLYRGLGEMYELSGQRETALTAWASMAQVRPREAEGYRAYAEKLTRLNMFEQAAANLRKALRYRPTVFETAKELADVYRKLDQPRQIPALWLEGEKACRKAMSDLADDPLPWLDLARFLIAQDRKDEAQAHLAGVLNKNWPRFHSETNQEAQRLLSELKR